MRKAALRLPRDGELVAGDETPLMSRHQQWHVAWPDKFATEKVGQCFHFDGMGAPCFGRQSGQLQLQDFTIEAWGERGSVTRFTGNEGGIVFGYGSGGYTLGMLGDGTPLLSQVDISGVFGTKNKPTPPFTISRWTRAGARCVLCGRDCFFRPGHIIQLSIQHSRRHRGSRR